MKTPKKTNNLLNFNSSTVRQTAVLAAFCSAFAATAVFAATETWQGPNGGDIGVAANWNGGLPSTANNDTAEWDGAVAGNLSLIYNTSTLASGYGSSGINLYLNAAQTGSVGITTTIVSANQPASSPLAIYDITIDSGAGAFTLGGTSATSSLEIIGRPSGADHVLINNSAYTATLTPWIVWDAGGGSQYELEFGGTGNWQVNSYLVNNNGSGGTLIQVDSGCTMTWNPSGFHGTDGISSPITINGELILAAYNSSLHSQNISLNGTFEFNAPSQAQALSGVLSGGGQVQVNGGTLTLAGLNTYSGNTLLSGGELIASATEYGIEGPLGVGGTISFTGGTLGFNIDNTYDYSPRFSTATGQAYSIDDGGRSVTLATPLGGAGNSFAKVVGTGIVTLSGAETYTGATTVSAGTLNLQGGVTGGGPINVANGATLIVNGNAAQYTPSALALGTSSGATLGFNNVNSTVTPIIAATAISSGISSGGTVTVNVNGGSFTVNDTYPLLSWTSGITPKFVLNTLVGAVGNLVTNGTTLSLKVTAIDYTWTGDNTADLWDYTTLNEWAVAGVAKVFGPNDTALFDDTATGGGGPISITIDGPVSPASVTFNDNTSSYTITEQQAGYDIGGATCSLTVNGAGTNTLSGGFNTYGGATILNAGVLSVNTLAVEGSAGGTASDIGASGNSAANLQFNGGDLQLNANSSGATSDRLFTLESGGATIDNESGGQLWLNNTGSIVVPGTGSRQLVLEGVNTSGDELDASLSDPAVSGQTSLVKTGAGTWILAGNNTQSGATTIDSGVLQIGAGGASGAIGTGNIAVTGNSKLEFDLTSTLTISGAVSGSGSVTNNGIGTVILAGNNTYEGGTGIATGGTLQIGTGGPGGSIYNGTINYGGGIVDNGTFIFDSTTPVTLSGYNAYISGTGNVIVRPGCFFGAISGQNNIYTGWTEIDTGATFYPCYGNNGGAGGNNGGTGLETSVITNNGTLYLTRQDGYGLPIDVIWSYAGNIVGTGMVVKENNNANPGWIGIYGTANTYSGGTFIAGGGIVLGDGVTVGAGTITGPVWFANTATPFLNFRTLVFDYATNTIFASAITSVVTDGSAVANQGALEQSGPGIVTLTASNSYPGGTTIDSGAGALQVANNNAIGASAVTDNQELDFILPTTDTVNNAISGTGEVVQMGSGTLKLLGANTYTGATIISNGTLVVTSVAGDMDIYGGILSPGGDPTINTLTVAGNLNMTAGTIVVYVNKSLAPSQSNTVINVTGSINITGGTVQLVNIGSASIAVGDTFNIFGNSPTVTSLSGLTVVAQGVVATINANGTVTATALLASPVITASLSGTTLTLSWPAAYIGSVLQSQANGVNGTWVTIPGTAAVNSWPVTINPANQAVFYRLAP